VTPAASVIVMVVVAVVVSSATNHSHVVYVVMAIVVDHINSSVVAGMMAVPVLPATGEDQSSKSQNNN